MTLSRELHKRQLHTDMSQPMTMALNQRAAIAAMAQAQARAPPKLRFTFFCRLGASTRQQASATVLSLLHTPSSSQGAGAAAAATAGAGAPAAACPPFLPPRLPLPEASVAACAAAMCSSSSSADARQPARRSSSLQQSASSPSMQTRCQRGAPFCTHKKAVPVAASCPNALPSMQHISHPQRLALPPWLMPSSGELTRTNRSTVPTSRAALARALLFSAAYSASSAAMPPSMTATHKLKPESVLAAAMMALMASGR